MATQALAVNGAKVYIVGRTQEKLDRVVETYNQGISGEIIQLPGDIIKKEDIAKLVQDLSSKEKKLDTPPEVKTAVLEDVLLGKYNGPKYAEAKDTLVLVESYVKRAGKWNAAAERGLEEKVRGLLGQPKPVQGDAKEAKA